MNDPNNQKLITYFKDPSAFILECCPVSHPIYGTIPFNLYQHQFLILDALIELRNSKTHNIFALKKARQMGVTSVLLSYALWCVIFKRSCSVAIVASHGPRLHLNNLKRIYYNLPPFILKLVGINSFYQKEIIFDNGSKIKFINGATDTCSESFDLCIIDEAAFCLDADFYQCLFPCTKKMFLAGTPTGKDSLFYCIWNSLAPENKLTIPMSLKVSQGVLAATDLLKFKDSLTPTNYSREIEAEFTD